MRIHQCQRRRLFHARQRAQRVDLALPHTIDVGAHTAHSLALPLQVAQFAGHQGVGDDVGVVGPQVGRAQDRLRDRAQVSAGTILQGDLFCFVVSAVFDSSNELPLVK